MLDSVFQKSSGADGHEAKTNIREKPGTSEREKSIREPKSCISRQAAEMNRRCLPTEDEPSLTAGRGSDLCQCADDLLQRYNMLESRRTDTNMTLQKGKSFNKRKGSFFKSNFEPKTFAEVPLSNAHTDQ